MLGDKIRQHRKRNHLSQEELAEKLGVSRQSVSLWENNQTQPSIENIIVLSKLLGVSTDELLSANNEEAQTGHDNAISVSAQPKQVPTPSEIARNYTAPIANSSEEIISKMPPKKKKSNKVLLIVIPVIVLIVAVGLFAAWGISQNIFFSLSAEEIFTKISPSVVEIYAESATETSTGTGFFIDNKGTVVTNYHVIENCQTAEITIANGNSFRVVSVLGYDSNRDIAVLSTSCSLSTPLSIRDGEVKTGEKVYAIGSSLGLTGSLSDGIVSAVDREVEGNTYIQTTAPISQGNSGGPLVDSKGEVVGIICASFTDGQNLNLAIPIEALESISLSNRVTLNELFPEAKQEVEWLSDYRFQYYAEEDIYVLLFQLSDKNKVPMSADGNVKIRIVNDNNATVYNKTHSFSSSNFEEWIYDDTDEMYVATIYISPKSIECGSTEYGTVYFEVYGSEYEFEECTLYAVDLPLISSSSSETPENKFVCLAPSCNNVVNNKGEYCSAHRCATIGCSYGKDGDSNYCSVCRCSSTGCKNPKIVQGYFCSIHTCIDYGCVLEKEQNSDYCNYHKPVPQQPTCLSTYCNNVVVKSGDYCTEHKCANGDCGYKKEPNAQYCSVCLCGISGCLNVVIKNGYYCADHTCSEHKCQYKKSADEKYCSYHACEICGELRLSTGLYCANHDSSASNNSQQENSSPSSSTSPSNQNTCSDFYCQNVVEDSGKYCSKHRCTNDWCSGKKDTNSYYCSVCECSNVGCKNPKVVSGYYCEEHTCNAIGCTSERQYSSNYCITHKCWSCDNMKIDNGSYCIDHTCSKNGCRSDKQYGSEYCMSHTCMAGFCKKETIEGGDYCIEHTCVAAGCLKQKLTSDYCYYHTP